MFLVYLLVGLLISFAASAVIWAGSVMAGADIDFRTIFRVVVWAVEILVVAKYVWTTASNYWSESREAKEKAEVPIRAQHDWDRPNEDSDYTEIIEAISRGESISDCAICGSSDTHGSSLKVKMHTSRAANRLANRFGRGAGVLQPVPNQHVVRVRVCSQHLQFLEYMSQEMAGRVRYSSLDEYLEELRQD